MTPPYYYNAFSGADSTLLNNQYLLAALASRNVNFKASETSQAQNTSDDLTSLYDTSTSSSGNNGIIPASSSSAQQATSSNAGFWVTGAIGAAALIAYATKGKGGKILSSFFNSAKKSISAKNGVLQNIKVLKKGNKVMCFVPGQRVKLTEPNRISNYIRECGIDRQALVGLKEGSSRLVGGTFKTQNGYTVTFEGDKIIKIVKKNKSLDIKSFDKTKLEEIKSEIETAKEMNEHWTKGFTEAKVIREVDDNIATVVYKKRPNEYVKPEITELNALKMLEREDKAVKSWLYEHPEENVIIGKNVFKRNNAPDGMKVGEASFTAKGITYHFNNGEIVGITKEGKYIAKGKVDCNEILADNEEEMKKIYDCIFNSDSVSDKVRQFLKRTMKGVDKNSIRATYIRA